MKSLIKLFSALSVSLFVSVACAQDSSDASDSAAGSTTTDSQATSDMNTGVADDSGTAATREGAMEDSEQLNQESSTRSPASVSIGEETRHPRAGMDSNKGREGETTAETAMGQTFTKPQVRDVQSALSERGFDVSVDGILGPQTQDALRRFQSEQGLEQSGSLDQATLRALNVEGEAERAPASVTDESSTGTDTGMGADSETQSETDL